MEWADFLANEAATHGLTPEQTKAFVERLKPENSGKSELNLAIELGIEEDTFTSLDFSQRDKKRGSKTARMYI